MSQRRSLLFVPAIRKDFLKKLNTYEPDSFILDLEDSIHAEYKDIARENLYKLDTKSINKEIIIRINEFGTEDFNKDLELLKKIDYYQGVMVPKFNNPESLEIITKVISKEKDILPIIETIDGFHNLKQNISTIKEKDINVNCLVFGAEDFSMELGINKDLLQENQLLTSIACSIILTAKIFKLDYIDCVFSGYTSEINLKKLEKESLFSKSNGADGKLLIHPSQINIVNKIFNITRKEISDAKEFIEKFETDHNGSAVSTKENYIMKDIPEYKKYKKLLKKSGVF